MAQPRKVILDALAGQAAMLEADGYVLSLDEAAGGSLTARVEAGPDACADCLVPKALMLRYFEDSLKSVFDLRVPNIRLVYPGETA